MRSEFDQGGSPITIGVLAIIGAMAGGTILATTMGTAAGVIGVILGALGGAVLGLGVTLLVLLPLVGEGAMRSMTDPRSSTLPHSGRRWPLRSKGRMRVRGSSNPVVTSLIRPRFAGPPSPVNGRRDSRPY